MLLRIQLGVSLFVCAAIAVAGVHLSAGTSAGNAIGLAVDNGVTGVALPQVEREIQATGRVFTEIGPGVNALKRSASGLYYILATPASVISVFGADGKRRASIPNANSKDAKIVYAADIDLDVTGRLYVADRGANAIKVFRPDGSLDATIPATAPTSIAALPEGEFAVETQRSDRLVDIIDAQGKLVRAFGDPSDLSGGAGSNRFLTHGRLVGDPAGFIYFAFTYSADPTIRKYDRYGYAAYEISLSADEFNPEADKRRDVLRLDRHTNVPTSKPTINAIGVDPLTQEVWAAIGNALLHFSKDGSRLPTYRTVTKDGARIEPKAILVEANRILLAGDPIGIFEFARPDKNPASSQNR
jgi:DNA-binding beta-propeller fold protein YncE